LSGAYRPPGPSFGHIFAQPNRFTPTFGGFDIRSIAITFQAVAASGNSFIFRALTFQRHLLTACGTAIVVLALLVPTFAVTRVDLDQDWQFRTDPASQGERDGWQSHVPTQTTSVSVPHTWNLGKHDGYVGKAWYFRSFGMPVDVHDLHVELHFGATFYRSRVWLNGVEIGTHEGGYTAYSFDITPHLQRENFLAVEVDNQISAETIPGLAMRGAPDAWYDWWDCGGIVRDVWLTLDGPIQVHRQQLRPEIQGDQAVVHDRVFLLNALPQKTEVSLSVTAIDADNRRVATTQSKVLLSPGISAHAVLVSVPHPSLWGLDHPSIYRMQVQLKNEKGSLLDQQSETFGVRKIEIRNDHLLINGERVRLTGIARHEDSVWEGLAETEGTMRRDYDDMKSLDVTLTRPVHYPQNPFILDYADRHGILLIPEIPVWQFSEAQLKDPKVIALAKQQIREMIEESGNHPSIFGWSVCNESDMSTPGGIAYFREMRDFIRKLDPDRFVSYADDHLPKLERAEDSAANDADFVMMNQYFGSWHGPREALGPALDKVHGLFPNKMIIISEFGFAGLFAKKPEDADPMRVEIIEEQMPELAKRDWIAGAILWCYQDYRSRRNLRPGQQESIVEHGLVDAYRQRKPSYYVWKDLNAPATMNVHFNTGQDNSFSFTITVSPNSITQLPSYPLHGYSLNWELCRDDGTLAAHGSKQLGDTASEETISGAYSGDTRGHLTLHLELLRPSGFVAAEREVNWGAPEGTQNSRLTGPHASAPVN
jgi:beta-glucuronidase